MLLQIDPFSLHKYSNRLSQANYQVASFLISPVDLDLDHIVFVLEVDRTASRKMEIMFTFVGFLQWIQLLLGLAKGSLDFERDPVLLRLSFIDSSQSKLDLLERDLGEHPSQVNQETYK